MDGEVARHREPLFWQISHSKGLLASVGPHVLGEVAWTLRTSSHRSRTGRVSRQCGSACGLVRLAFLERTLSSQISHWYGLSPVWIRMCLVRLLDSENLMFPQISHSKGFSPVWVRIVGGADVRGSREPPVADHRTCQPAFSLPCGSACAWSPLSRHMRTSSRRSRTVSRPSLPVQGCAVSRCENL